MTELRPALAGRDLLTFGDLDRDEILAVLDLAASIKAGSWRDRPLEGSAVAMILQKPSNRTRVSFEVGIRRLGGHPVVMGDHDIDLGVREAVPDVAHVLERYVDMIIARLRRHEDLAELAECASIPVVNALTDRGHPCQVLSDMMTLRERFADLQALDVTWVGDGNNVCASLVEAAALLGFALTVVSPPGFEPPSEVVERARRLAGGSPRVRVTNDLAAVRDTAAVYTDVWTSMGQEAERDRRARAFAEYRIDGELMAQAPDAVFLHCLPAHRGEEVTDEVMDGPQSLVFDQAENRLYAQMALMALLAA
jgi:ornithine carbamoyltransferase